MKDRAAHGRTKSSVHFLSRFPASPQRVDAPCSSGTSGTVRHSCKKRSLESLLKRLPHLPRVEVDLYELVVPDDDVLAAQDDGELRSRVWFFS